MLRSDLLLTVEEIEKAAPFPVQVCGAGPDSPGGEALQPPQRDLPLVGGPEQGASGEEEVVQYDRVVPLGPAITGTRSASLLTPRFTRRRATSPSASYIDLPEKWWVACDALARECGHRLAKLEHTRFHGFRRLRRTELKQAKIHDKDVAFSCGWTIHSFLEAKASVAMNGMYLGFIPEDLVEAVCAGEGNSR